MAVIKSFTVLIPALNEEKNIGGLLDDILEQELGDSLVLEKVIVVSDGSTDSTEDIVRARSARDPRVNLVVNESRMGKPCSLNIGKREVDSDFLVHLDGDVRLNGRHTLRNLLEGHRDDVGLVGGNPVPVEEAGESLAALISRCGDIMRNDIMLRIRGGRNIYSAYGRIIAMSRAFYSAIEMPVIEGGNTLIAEDQFIYLSCVKLNMRYEFRGDAEVLYGLPTSFKDYLNQVVRFLFSAVNTKAYFDDSRLTAEYRIPLPVKVVALTNLVRREPLGAAAWLGYRVIVRVRYLARRLLFKGGVGETWEVSESTKSSIGGL